MKIEILHTITLHSNLAEYREVKDSVLTNYGPGIYECAEEYRDRFERVPAYISIIEDVVEEAIEVVEEAVEEIVEVVEEVKKKPAKAKKDK